MDKLLNIEYYFRKNLLSGFDLCPDSQRETIIFFCLYQNTKIFRKVNEIMIKGRVDFQS